MKKLLSLLLALSLLCLSACGGGDKEDDDPNVGMWNAVSMSMLGIEMEVADIFDGGVTLEIKSNGKFTLNADGDKGSGKWEYEGKDMRMTASGVDMVATVSDGVLTLTNLLDMGVDVSFEKEGGYSGGTSSGGSSSGAAPGIGKPASKSGVDYYVIDTISDEEMTMERELLLELGLDWYILLNDDGTADAVFDERMTGTWGDGIIDLGDAGVMDYSIKGKIMTVTIEGETMTLRLSDEAPPELPPVSSGSGAPGGGDTAEPVAELTALQEWWSGDWYGYWEVYGASDGYADWEDLGYMDCYARIELDADGKGLVYLWDDGGEIGTVEIEASESSGSGSMGAALSTGGRFMDYRIDRAEWIIDPSLYDYESYMVIDGSFENPDYSGEGFFYNCYLRPWGVLWDDMPFDERPPFYDWYRDNYGEDMLEAIYYSVDGGGIIHPELESALFSGGTGGGTEGGTGGDFNYKPDIDLTIDPGDIEFSWGTDNYGEDGWVHTTNGFMKMQIPEGWEVELSMNEESIGVRSAAFGGDSISVRLSEYFSKENTPESQAKMNAGDDEIFEDTWGNTRVLYRIEDVEGRDIVYVKGFAAYDATHYISFDIRVKRENGTLEEFMNSVAWKTLRETFELVLP